jgi:hypothetical protein
MTRKTWEFRLDGVKHKVELEYAMFFSRWVTIRVDESTTPIRYLRNQEPLELATKYPFQVAGHTCAVVMIPDAIKYECDLELDGVSVATGQSINMEEIRLRQRKVIGLQSAKFTLVVGIALGWYNWYLLHTEGHYYPKVAFFTPIFILISICTLIFLQAIVDQYYGKVSFIKWLAIIIIFLLLGFANNYLLGHGLY